MWRQKHESFVKTIREARQVQQVRRASCSCWQRLPCTVLSFSVCGQACMLTFIQVIASGGDISRLPPPPRDEHPEYVQCPHCARRFDEAVSQRHIPWCATQVLVAVARMVSSLMDHRPSVSRTRSPPMRPHRGGTSTSPQVCNPRSLLCLLCIAHCAAAPGRPGSATKAMPVSRCEM